jgi:hypothetical protein
LCIPHEISLVNFLEAVKSTNLYNFCVWRWLFCVNSRPEQRAGWNDTYLVELFNVYTFSLPVVISFSFLQFLKFLLFYSIDHKTFFFFLTVALVFWILPFFRAV